MMVKMEKMLRCPSSSTSFFSNLSAALANNTIGLVVILLYFFKILLGD